MATMVGLMPVGAWFGVAPTLYAHALILAVTFGIFFGTLSLGRGKPAVVHTPLPGLAPGGDKGVLGSAGGPGRGFRCPGRVGAGPVRRSAARVASGRAQFGVPPLGSRPGGPGRGVRRLRGGEGEPPCGAYLAESAWPPVRSG